MSAHIYFQWGLVIWDLKPVKIYYVKIISLAGQLQGTTNPHLVLTGNGRALYLQTLG